MPYFSPLNFDNDQDKQKDQNGINVSGSSNVISNPSNPGQATNRAKQISSGAFTNLQQYLDANKDNTSKMGSTITGNIDQTAQDATSKVNTFKSNAPQDIQKLSSNDVTGMLDNAANTDKNQYKSYKAGYTGPESYDKVNGYDDASKAWSKANENIKQTQTEEGRQNLLTNTYSRPNYSQGQKTFDNLLIQNDPNSRAMFENTASKWSGINSILDNATTDIGNRINTNKENSSANKQVIGDTEKAYLDNFKKPITQRADDYNKSLPDKQNSTRDDLVKKTLTPEEMAALGLSDGQEIYNLNLGNYLNTNSTNATVNNVATPEERARWAALQNLLDGNDTSITSSGEQLSPYSFNRDKLTSDLNAAKTARDLEDSNRRSTRYTIAADPYTGQEVGFTNLQHVIDSGYTNAADYLKAMGWDLSDPQVRTAAGRIQNDLAFLNHHNRVSSKK